MSDRNFKRAKVNDKNPLIPMNTLSLWRLSIQLKHTVRLIGNIIQALTFKNVWKRPCFISSIFLPSPSCRLDMSDCQSLSWKSVLAAWSGCRVLGSPWPNYWAPSQPHSLGTVLCCYRDPVFEMWRIIVFMHAKCLTPHWLVCLWPWHCHCRT